jgi:hypothetical protein
MAIEEDSFSRKIKKRKRLIKTGPRIFAGIRIKCKGMGKGAIQKGQLRKIEIDRKDKAGIISGRDIQSGRR